MKNEVTREVKSGWASVEFLKSEDIDRYSWFKGFFIYNKEKWIRNFTELKLRDISIFTLGDIQGKRILDIGSGVGLYSLTLLKLGAGHVSAIDISQKAVEQTNSICKENGFRNYEVKPSSCTELPFENNSFDMVFSGDVFEHITEEQKQKSIAEIFRVLKPGGSVTIKTPNLNYLRISIFLKRLYTILKFKNPFMIHIAHTKNNPDNEHHGLTTHKKLISLFLNNTFHEPAIIYHELERKGLPKIISRFFRRSKYFNEHIIITARKPVFYGLYD